MFTRVIEFVAKPGKAREVARTLQDKGLPLLRSQPGIVDDLLLVSDTEPERILALSIWTNLEDADRYQRRYYREIKSLIERWLEVEPVIKTFHVESSMAQRVSRGRTA